MNVDHLNADSPRADIVFVSHTAQVSGAERVLLDLVGHGVTRGDRIAVVCPDGPLADALPAEVAHHRAPELGLQGRRGMARLVGLAGLAADSLAFARVVRAAATAQSVVVVNSMLALPAVRAARLDNTVTWLDHDLVEGRRARTILSIAKPTISRAVAVSEETAEPLRELGLPVRIAVNGTAWPVPAADLDDRNPPVVGMLALLTPWKGQRVLLEAIAQLPGVELEIAGGVFPGDEDYAADLRERAQRSDLAGRVRFLGHVNAAATLPTWSAAVSASTSPEAGPLGVLEAMAHGVPVVGTDLGGTRSYLGGAGILVPPDDPVALAAALGDVLADGDLRRRLAHAQRSRVADRHDLAVTLPALYLTLTSTASMTTERTPS